MTDKINLNPFDHIKKLQVRIDVLEAALREIFAASVGKSAEITRIASAALNKDTGK